MHMPVHVHAVHVIAMMRSCMLSARARARTRAYYMFIGARTGHWHVQVDAPLRMALMKAEPPTEQIMLAPVQR